MATLMKAVRLGESKSGGGRGVYAARDIAAGELLMAERPVVLCPAELRSNETLHVGLARHLLSLERERGADGGWRATDARVAELLDRLHPRSPGGPLAAAFADELAEQVAYLERQQGARPPRLSRAEVLRVLLQVRLNAFASGLYLELSMINHACAPNAVKFRAEDDARDGRSRVCALRPLRSGEEVTICYLGERLLSHAARRAALLAQHRFCVGPSPFPPPLDLPPPPPEPRAEMAGGEVWRRAAAVALLEARLDALAEELRAEGIRAPAGAPAPSGNGRAEAPRAGSAAAGRGGEGRLQLLTRVASSLLLLLGEPQPLQPPCAQAEAHDEAGAQEGEGTLSGHLCRGRLCRMAAQVVSQLLQLTPQPARGEPGARAAEEARTAMAVSVLRACVELNGTYARMHGAQVGGDPARGWSQGAEGSQPHAPVLGEAGAAAARDGARHALLLPASVVDPAVGEHYELASHALAFLLASSPARLLREFGGIWPSAGRAASEQCALLEAAARLSGLFAPPGAREQTPAAERGAEGFAARRGPALPAAAAAKPGPGAGGAALDSAWELFD